MNILGLRKFISGSDFEKVIDDLYSISDKEGIVSIKDRYSDLIKKVEDHFSDGDYHIVSSPGRAEICGNHTDHQNGFVVATALDIDNVCIVKKVEDNKVTYIDEHFEKMCIDLTDLAKKGDEINKAESIIRGIAKRFFDLGYKIGGFDAFCHSKVLVGSSMSSSACFELMIVEIFNTLYNGGKINDIDRAKIAQWAENNYFCKPCGLMDQMAISVGSFVGIDFFDIEKPVIKKHDFTFDEYGYDFYIVNTKGSHENLTDEYAAIPGEMKMVSKFFGKEKLSEVPEKDFYENITAIRENVKNDRAILRAYHFYNENNRAKMYDKELDKKDIRKILDIMNESGKSSYMYLQNVYPSSNPKNQGISIGLAISSKYIGDGATRVQGGGFAGTIQTIIRCDLSKDYVEEIEKVFGKGTALKVKIRKYGTKTIL